MNKPIHKQPVFGEDDDDAADQFYESLDRIATSSSCSTSNSDDSDPDPPQFSNYDLWISEPSSVSERRRTLLRHMGLSYDSSLSRSLVPPHFNFTPPHHSHHFPPHPFLTSNIPAVSRSKSDRRLDRRDDDYHPASPVAACNHDFNSSSSSSSFLSVYSSSILLSDDSITVNSLNNNHSDKAVVVANSKKNASVVSASKHTNLSSSPKFSATDAAAAASPSKPPSGKHGRSMDVTRSFSNTSIGGELMEGGSDCHGDDTSAVELTQACTIKNLDTGKEFVVNEIREDGMWNKLKEVGTGRQLTMEEFEMTVGHSPIVQELMRRQNVEDGSRENHESNCNGGTGAGGPKLKKKGGWLRSIKNVASSVKGHKERRSSDEKDTGSERGGRRSSSATDDSQDASFHGPERVRVKQYGKSSKELTAVYKSQETQAHTGSIWAIKFSLDGRYLASAGEDCVIHVWQVVEAERKGELLLEKQEDANFNLLVTVNGSPEPVFLSTSADGHNEKRRRGRSSLSRKSLSLEHIIVPETVFALTDKPICSFEGHIDDVLDLSWSKSQHLLSSSMDKTVRLWHLSSKTCLKIFSHSDYVTCIQFNPVDDRYFISGSLDSKVRIWSIPDRQVVDWNDVHEMVTAACYTPDGQVSIFAMDLTANNYSTSSENKLQQKCQINLQNKKKKSHLKKITGFQFVPGSSSEVLITSADSRIRVIDRTDLVHKFKGFRNTNSQMSSSVTANGKFVVSASEDSYVYVWKHEADSRLTRSKGVTVTRSYEHFHCQDVSAAIPWPGIGETWGHAETCWGLPNGGDSHADEVSIANHPPTPAEEVSGGCDRSRTLSGCSSSPLNGIISSATNGYFFDRISATWPEEKLNIAARNRSPRTSMDVSNGLINQNVSAYGMVIVTAGLRGEIRAYQNFGLPVRI
ncbi:WD repeat-containing protein 44 [Linum perenne]